MSHTKASHKILKDLLDHLNMNSAQMLTAKTLKSLHEQIQRKTTTPLERKFISGLIKLGTIKYFLIPDPFENSICIVSKNLNALMSVALHTTDRSFLNLYKSAFILDLLHIHSYQKGEGKKLIEEFKTFQQELNIPGSLWTEVDENVHYFKQYGFENLGKLGSNGEYLMKLPI